MANRLDWTRRGEERWVGRAREELLIKKGNPDQETKNLA